MQRIFYLTNPDGDYHPADEINEYLEEGWKVVNMAITHGARGKYYSMHALVVLETDDDDDDDED